MRQAAEASGDPLTDTAARALQAWLTHLVQWNARIDLTAARTLEELVDLMLADALILARHVPRGARVVDVGTGAGAPGLALAILRPDLAVALVEPLAKRTAFLRTVLSAIGRADVRVDAKNGEAVVRAGETFDVAVSRATLPPRQWLALGLRLVTPGSSVWVLLARDSPPAVAEGEGEERETVAYRWPLTAAERRAVRYVRR